MSVVEFKHPVMVLSFNYSDLHCCALDGYKGNNEALLNRLKQIDDYFASKSKVSTYKLWFNIDDNVLTDDIIENIAISLYKINDNIFKLAVIGAGKKKRRFDKALRKTTFNKPIAYFSDAESAKEWLVGEKAPEWKF